MAKRGTNIWELAFYPRCVVKSAHVTEHEVEHQRRAEGVRVVNRRRMASEVSWTTGTGIGDIPKTVKAGRILPALRIPDTEQVVVAEAMIHFDVELIA